MSTPATPYFFCVSQDTIGEFRWRFYGPDTQVIAVSGEAYADKDDCVASLNLVATHGSGATIFYEANVAQLA